MAAQFDFDNFTKRLKQIESFGGDYNARNKSGAWGAYQFMPKTAKQYGLAYGTASPAEQDAAYKRLTQDNYNSLSKSLGQAPEPWQLYLAHQAGATGAANLLKGDPNAPLEKNQLANNPFNAQTVGEWLSGWQNKFNRTSPSGEVNGGAKIGVSPAGQNNDIQSAYLKAVMPQNQEGSAYLPEAAEEFSFSAPQGYEGFTSDPNALIAKG